jgi:alcohol dehydrogenase class IV
MFDKPYIIANRIYHGVFAFFKAMLHWRHPVMVQGEGVTERLPELLRACKVRHPMLVTDPFLKDALAPQIESILQQAGVEYTLYYDVAPNPTVANCEHARDEFRKNGCDSFIALGGGAPMDTAKACGALIARPRKKLTQMNGLLRVGREIPPLIAIPTTAGTGSETTVAAVIVDQETHHKAAIMDLVLMPKYAVLDPCMTVGLPPMTTATTGMDALVHALEAYFSRSNSTKETNQLAEDAVRLIFKYLERAYRDGHDMEARAQMQIAAYKAGFAFSRVGVGNVHAIAHTLGGLYNTPHGLANSVILPYILKDYGSVVYKKLAHLSAIVGLKLDGTEQERAEAFIAEIEAMNRRMGIPEKFDFIRDEDIEQMITWAMKEANPVYPVPQVYTREHFRQVIEQIRA